MIIGCCEMMKETTIEEVEKKASLWQSQGKRWHFHMLTPDCTFNKRNDKHAFVLENRTDNETYAVYSDKRYMETGQKLVKMIHGDKILGKSKENAGSTNENIKTILKKAKELTEKGVQWHHHMLFPDCIFNKHPGKWNITFEDRENNSIIEALYDKEPVNDLREIEILYYKQKR